MSRQNLPLAILAMMGGTAYGADVPLVDEFSPEEARAALERRRAERERLDRLAHERRAVAAAAATPRPLSPAQIAAEKKRAARALKRERDEARAAEGRKR